MTVRQGDIRERPTGARVRRRIAAALSAALLVTLLPAGASQRPADAQTDPTEVVEETTSAGTDFWFAFPANAAFEAPATLQLFITGEQPAEVSVTVPGLGFEETFALDARAIRSVTLPEEAQLSKDAYPVGHPFFGQGTVAPDDAVVRNKGVRVTSDAPITVYGMSRIPKSTDAFLAYPVSSLGTRYRALSLGTHYWWYDPGGFTVVATEDDTEVAIELPASPDGGRSAGTVVLQLGAGDAYQLLSAFEPGDDLSGVLVTADKPIALMGSHPCARLPEDAGMCDHVVQQLLPVSAWGTTYAIAGLEGKAESLVELFGPKRYTVRVVADEAGTEVRIDGELVEVLGAGEVHSSIHSGDILIQTSRPTMVAQFAHGLVDDVVSDSTVHDENFFDSDAEAAATLGAIGDPFMLLVPSTDQFLNAYTVLTAGEPSTDDAPGAFEAHYVNLVAFSPDPGITRNGAPVTETFREVGGAGSGIWVTSLSVDDGAHRFDAGENFGVFVYGWTPEDSYGYPGGSAFRSVGSVTGITVSAPATSSVGSPVCAAAELEAPEDASLTGVQVTWTADGPQDADQSEQFSGRSSSDASGRSQFCFTPTRTGAYVIGGTAGAGFEGSATVEIVPVPVGAVGQAFTFLRSPDGTTPSAPTGSAVWQQADGTTVPLAVSSPAPGQVRYEADGVRLTLTGAAGTSASRGLVANPNGEVECEICAQLAAVQVIEAWMFSTPRLVAAWRVEDLPCQRFTIPVVAPLDGGGPVTAGTHTLQLALPTADGMQAVNVGVTVGGPVPGSVPAGEGPMVPAGLIALGLLAAAGGVLAGRRQLVTG